MDAEPFLELATIENLLAAADVPQEERESALWCVRQLAPLYRDFARTYDGRFSDEVVWLARAALDKVSRSPVATAVREAFVALHERVGLDASRLRVPEPRARRPRKAG